MHQLRRILLSLVAGLLLLQWAAALQPCLRSLAQLASAEAVEICSASGGYHTVLVDEDGKPLPDTQAHAGCPLCQHGGTAMLPAPGPSLAVPYLIAEITHGSSRAQFPPLPPRGPPQRSRAPPIV